MNLQISSLELHYVLKELDLVDCRLNKVYQRGEDFLFDFHKPGVGKRQLRVLLPRAAFLTKYKPDFPKMPPKFCMFLRKRIAGSFLREIRQVGFERIVELVFEAGDETYVLVIELFSKGNMVLCRDGKIVSPLKSQNWEARTVRGGTEYEYPPEQVNTLELDFEAFWDVLEKSDMDSVVKSLAVDFGLGGTYAEELCTRTQVSKVQLPAKVDEDSARSLFDSLQDLLDADVRPVVIDGRVYPFPMESVPGEGDGFGLLNEAIDETVSRKLVERKEEKRQDLKEEKIAKIQNVLDEQIAAVEKMKRDIEENTRKGELLFENYGRVSQLLHEMKSDAKNMSMDELRDKYLGHDLVEQVNDGLVIINI